MKQRFVACGSLSRGLEHLDTLLTCSLDIFSFRVVQSTMDPSQSRFCACCYKEVHEEIVTCKKCEKRIFCSDECRQKDWKDYAHKFYCEKSGEIGHAFEIKSAGGNKGLGMFALRDIGRNEIIIAERPLITANSIDTGIRRRYPEVPQGSELAVATLHPVDGSFEEKFEQNAFSCADSSDADHKQGMFIVMSRVNHDCIGNSTHRYSDRLGVKILVANHKIKAGEEITFSYVSHAKTKERKERLRTHYKFQCNCRACEDEAVAEDLDQMVECDKFIMHVGAVGMTDMAILTGITLIELYDKYQVSSWLYHRTYYDMYQMAIAKRSTFKKATGYIQKSYQAALDFTSDPNDEDVKKVKKYVNNPKSHYACGMFDMMF
jgi:SET domain